MGQERKKAEKRKRWERQREGWEGRCLTPSTIFRSRLLPPSWHLLGHDQDTGTALVSGESVLIARIYPMRGPLCPKEPGQSGAGP